MAVRLVCFENDFVARSIILCIVVMILDRLCIFLGPLGIILISPIKKNGPFLEPFSTIGGHYFLSWGLEW